MSEVSGRRYGGVSAADREESRKQLLIEAARKIIAADGVAAITAEQVCAVAGLTKRYFYQTFDSKVDLLNCCADLLFAELAGTILVKMEVPGKSLEQRLYDATEAGVHALASDPAWARLYRECPAFPALRERQQQAVSLFTDRMLEALPFGGDATDPARLPLAARMVLAGSVDLMTAWLSGDIEASERTVVETIVATGWAALSRTSDPT